MHDLKRRHVRMDPDSGRTPNPMGPSHYLTYQGSAGAGHSDRVMPGMSDRPSADPVKRLACLDARDVPVVRRATSFAKKIPPASDAINPRKSVSCLTSEVNRS